MAFQSQRGAHHHHRGRQALAAVAVAVALVVLLVVVVVGDVAEVAVVSECGDSFLVGLKR